jgi:Alpha-glutamyl/putrescinyl thymine pyrophosphorylase clade 3
MRPRERERARDLDEQLLAFCRDKHPLLGIQSAARRAALVAQIVESIRRVEFIAAISNRDISDLRADPSSDLFDPIKAAILHTRRGNIDEAFWLTFLSVLFGKHKRSGWRLARDIYGALGANTRWDWATTSKDPQAFRQWLAKNETVLKGADGIERHFGNHRKYTSLDAGSTSGTGAAVESYVKWVRPPRTHEMLITDAQKRCAGNKRKTFDYLYHSMRDVASFGRLAKFDYLTLLGKLRLADIEPGSTYMEAATGPLAGARLLFSWKDTLSPRDLDSRAVELGDALGVGMQVMEDALCNWQKSPDKFVPFRG